MQCLSWWAGIASNLLGKWSKTFNDLSGFILLHKSYYIWIIMVGKSLPKTCFIIIKEPWLAFIDSKMVSIYHFSQRAKSS